MWARIATMVLGVWLMAAPAVLNYGGLAAKSGRIVGPLAVSVGIIAIWEVTRPARWLSLPLGLWLLVAPWLLTFSNSGAMMNSMLVGLLLILLAFIAGQVKEQFGGGWSSLWREEGVLRDRVD